MKIDKRTTLLVSVIVLLMFSGLLPAHHGTNISYDMTRPITLEGIVTEFAFRNPHCQIYFDVEDENGNLVKWAAEASGPRGWTADGWGDKDTLKLGDRITITVHPSKAGTPRGDVRGILLPDGTVLGEVLSQEERE